MDALSRNGGFRADGRQVMEVAVGTGTPGKVWEGHEIRARINNPNSSGKLSEKTKAFITGLLWYTPEMTAPKAVPEAGVPKLPKHAN